MGSVTMTTIPIMIDATVLLQDVDDIETVMASFGAENEDEARAARTALLAVRGAIQRLMEESE